ncbi:MAG: transketolase [Geobacter sp.]|nr:transketolase [Geobacter sp.]
MSSEQQFRLGANTLRMLAVDAVEMANSGHPGLPMGAADYAFLLWHSFLSFNPADPAWPNRDRFILSAGHGSMLLYGLLHLFGYDLALEDLEKFRQWGSRTPGHPEYGHTPGVEVTTGPLGQGFGNAVGMALAGRMAAARFNDGEFRVIDHRVYALASDGDMMEGISSEAASLAGHLGLGNLICIYDDNRITIEGETELAFSEDVGERFAAYSWHVQRIDGHDIAQIGEALTAAREETGRPSLIIARTHIGHGSPGKHDTAAVHGAPLGPEEAAATRKNLGWPDEKFHVPPEVRALCATRVAELLQEYSKWQVELDAWRKRNSERSRLWDIMWGKTIPADLGTRLIAAIEQDTGATRTLSGKVIQKIAALVPAFVSGSADLEPSTNTGIKDASSVTAADFSGRNLHFGVREHAMAAIMNGMARYGCFLPCGSTFLIFSDYCRPSIRLATLMGVQVAYVFTHDSVLLGEDGPTHQPVEHLSSLRLIPNLLVIRPADGAETALAWESALKNRQGPTALILSRQKLPLLERKEGISTEEFAKGAYIVRQEGGAPHGVALASGSEVWLAVAAAGQLEKEGIALRVVSVPCLERFLAQPPEYRAGLLPPGIPRIAVEAGQGGLWWRLLGEDGLFIGVDTFGASAPERDLAENYGLTPDQVAARIRYHLAGGKH